VHAKTFSRTEENAKDTEVERDIPVVKSYTVFHVGQNEALPMQH
jgi:antirestriction protein ArdC